LSLDPSRASSRARANSTWVCSSSRFAFSSRTWVGPASALDTNGTSATAASAIIESNTTSTGLDAYSEHSFNELSLNQQASLSQGFHLTANYQSGTLQILETARAPLLSPDGYSGERRSVARGTRKAHAVDRHDWLAAGPTIVKNNNWSMTRLRRQCADAPSSSVRRRGIGEQRRQPEHANQQHGLDAHVSQQAFLCR
jgi:hypothetical protein